jgi:hypothetical protein
VTDPAEIIRDRAHAVVKGVMNDEVGSWRWIKKLVATTTKEYRGRFLYELIQNGFDAHPADARDGRIAVHFHEDEGAHGVLYVANGGKPLSKSNFEKMASLGDSDKEIGVGIGNKGVGFKSVFQICSVPEVFSAANVKDPGFSGFTFRFGTERDLDGFDLSGKDAAKVSEQLSFSLLTVPLEVVPPRVLELREAGYVTVIRLPASSQRAAAEIGKRIERLLGSKSPIMLFLDRLEALSVQASTESGPAILSRREEAAGFLTRVILNDYDNFFLFRSNVPNEEIRAALEESVEEGALDPAWLAWKEDATVSVAVGDGWLVDDPAPFTFLPMSDDASSPLSGHINAPFITDFARLGVDHEQPVNRLLMSKISELCAKSANSLIDRKAHANNVVDLLAWSEPEVAFLKETVARLYEITLGEFIRLPVIGRDEWCSVAESSNWPQADCSVITAERAMAAADAFLIDPRKVDAERIEQLEQTFDLAPAPDIMATWVEKIAASLLDSAQDFSVWRGYYDDLGELFDSGEPLANKNIILTQTMELAPTEQLHDPDTDAKTRKRQQRAVFFSPKTAGTEDDDAVDSDLPISPPRTLASRLVFVHRDLDWYERGEQTSGRHFLQSQSLVRQFRVSTLLGFLGRLLRDKTHDAVKRDALRFSYALFASDPTKHTKELAAVGLSVPSSGGEWIPAPRALFTKEWPIDGGKELSALAAFSEVAESELAQLRTRLVADPADFELAEEDVKSWSSFLRILGVSAALPVNTVKDPRRITGNSLIAAVVAGATVPGAVPPMVADQWLKGITGEPNRSHPETQFSTQQPICWLAGQGEAPELPPRLRRDYARLVMLTLPNLTESQLYSTWRRERPGGVSSVLGSPLLAFLRTAEWVPVTVSGRPTTVENLFCRPNESWYVGVEDQMAAVYSPLVAPRLRALMEAIPPGSELWREIGFLNWTDEEAAALLIDHLTELFGQNEIPDTARDHFRSTLATCWATVGDPHYETQPHLEDALLIERSGQFELQTRDDLADQTLYVSAKGDQSASARLVRELGWPTLLVDSSEVKRLNEVARVLASSWQEDVQVTSDWDLEVRVDGRLLQSADSDPLLNHEIPWLPLLIGSVMRYPQVSSIRIGRQLQRVLDDLGRIRLVRADDLAIVTTSGDQALPARLHGVLPMTGDMPALLAEGLVSPPTWAQLEYLLRGVLELLGQERFTTEISLAVRKLAPDAERSISCPSITELAEVLQVTEAEISDVAMALSADVSAVLSRLSVVGPCLWGEASIDALGETSMMGTSREALLEILTGLCGSELRSREIYDAAAVASSADTLRRSLKISLEDFNACLSRHFSWIQLVTNEVEQKEEFDLRVRTRRPELRDRARRARIGRFRAGESQPDWPEIRSFHFLKPDPDWATRFDDLGDEFIDLHIDRRMDEILGVGHRDDGSLQEWPEVQLLNGKPLRARILESRRTVRAWCGRAKLPVPANWEADDFADSIRQALDNVGALDFDALADDALAEWLDHVGVWPAGMALTLDPSQHGLTADELTEQESAEAEARAAKARAARQVEFQGREIDLDRSMSNLVESVSAFLSADPASLRSAYRTAQIQVIPERGERTGNGIPGPGSDKSSIFISRLSQVQASAIGLVGEMIAYHWLVGRDPGLVDETCWKSGNVRLVFEGTAGDDRLGYDFEVPRKGGSVMYEVKATTGDAGVIELGETEVRCAQENSRNDRWRLLVVENALSDAPRVHMLPNPFHHNSRSLFEFVGNRVRLQFRLGF